ncbi:hypothetical protein Pan241w_42820 [Gimesia alba]|uniref:Uncharacterized protein n=1 Tax=Gimesia alba TaxID=2527973 RepID=A0A517RJW3_9PLAN|nr:hypothetical protein Pan241w_42820 [Gimesia alba]
MDDLIQNQWLFKKFIFPGKSKDCPIKIGYTKMI